MSAPVPMFRWRTLPPGYHAQPTPGGERNGIRWVLERVYDPRGKLDRNLTYWEVYQSLADDPAPRSVAYADVAPMGVPFVEFSRTTTPLAQVEQWIERARRRVAPTTQRAKDERVEQPLVAPTPQPT